MSGSAQAVNLRSEGLQLVKGPYSAETYAYLNSFKVEKINIDHPEVLDPGIRKTRNILVAITVAVVIAFLIMLIPGSLRLAGVISKPAHLFGALGAWVAVSVAFGVLMAVSHKYEQANYTLRECQKAMRDAKFKEFVAESGLPEDFSIEQLVKTCTLFREHEGLAKRKAALVESQNQFAVKIERLQRSFGDQL